MTSSVSSHAPSLTNPAAGGGITTTTTVPAAAPAPTNSFAATHPSGLLAIVT
jgi:hypothetical protein